MIMKFTLGGVPARVQLALERKLSPSDLQDFEQEIFFDLLTQCRDSEAGQAAFASEMLQEAGNVGYDEDGNLVKTLGGGDVEILNRDKSG